MLNFTLLKKLREIIYHAFPIRRDANMNLLDALSSYGHRCTSVVELSESPHFERQYSSITDGIADGLHAARWGEATQAIYTASKGNGERVVLIADCRCLQRYPSSREPVCFGSKA